MTYCVPFRLGRQFFSCMMVALLLACGMSRFTSAQVESISAWEAADFRSWSFVPYWTTQTQLESFPTDNMVDHVSDVLYFSGVRPTASGNLNYHSRAADHLATLADQSAEHGFRFHMSMFDTYGGSVETVWNSIVSNPATRAHFVDEVTALLQTHGMTGFNLDWERPNTVTEWANYTQLAKELKEAIGPLGMEVSVDDYGFADTRWDDSDVFDARIYDQLFIMGYHYPAFSSDSLNNNSFADRKLALTGQGPEKAFVDEQLVLGIGTWGSGPSVKTLKEIVAATPDLPYDAETWTSGSSTWNIESREQVRDKVQLALDRNMAGVMYWALHYDAPGELGLHRVAHHKIVFERDIPDLNLDGRVSAADAEALSDQIGTVPGWTGTNTAARFDRYYLQGNWERGDHNGNGFVNQEDADWLAGRFGVLGVDLPDRLAYTGSFENFEDGAGLAGRWRVLLDGSGNLPESGNFTQHGTGRLAWSGSGPGADKYSGWSVTLRNQNGAEAYDSLNTDPRTMEADLSVPLDLGQTRQTYFTFLVRQNTAPLLATQLASDQRDLFLQFHDASGTNQFDVSLKGSSGQVAIDYRADPGGEDVAADGFLPDVTYLLVGKVTGNADEAGKVELAIFPEGAAVADFRDARFPWMLTALSSPRFDPVITRLSLESRYEANYTVSNLQIGPVEHFFSGPLPGDYDNDSTIDGIDFLKWQQGNSPTPLDAADLVTWEANFGLTMAATAASAAIPEPATWIVLFSGMTMFLQCRSENSRAAIQSQMQRTIAAENHSI